MRNGRKRLFAAFAASISLAAVGAAAAPASAQTSGGGGFGNCQYDPWSGNWYRSDIITHLEPCDPNYSSGNCQYDPWSGNWYRRDIITHLEPCDPYSQAREEPAERPAETEAPGR